MMGCSNLHPHAQIWATENVPTEPAKECQTQREYFEQNGRPLLFDYLQSELDADERIVTANDYFAAMVPWWATWPYEILILPFEPVATPADLSPVAVTALAQVLKQVLSAYDRLFGTATPYSMGFHPSPSNGENCSGWTFHAHLYPPLLRSATVRKHMVGFEMLAMPQRDLTPEAAAARLKKIID